MNIGEKIRYYRKKLNLSQEELANKSGLSRNAIYNYEKGKRQPDFGVLNDIADALGCHLYDLTIDSEKLRDDIKIIESEKLISALAEKCGITIQEDYDNDENGKYLRNVYISYSNKNFKLTPTEYHELTKRILESLATNILAAENYDLLSR